MLVLHCAIPTLDFLESESKTKSIDFLLRQNKNLKRDRSNETIKLTLSWYSTFLLVDKIKKRLTTIKKKDIEHFYYIIVTMYFVQVKAVLSFQSVIEIKATEQYFPIMLFIMLHKMVLTSTLFSTYHVFVIR